ncbi:hypothetical protein IDH44_13295 [Paenibacillus sp. IB182496]|uniref:Helicase XPB/Ssl2 N-terminal domain-containing protein n=1 Tax=Paenibacillus sabuli TaxID=2772509 RepID=A0A927BV14_9BACL|nr:hypothetical protein [Paenibacillus sabuli]MBD2846175.1 hypothetical protein [Paenibacillus sabuli]
MKSADYETLLSAEEAGRLRAEPLWHSGACGRTWPQALTCPCCAAGALPRLSQDAQAALRLMLRRCGARPMTERQLVRLAEEEAGPSGAETLLGLDELRRCGLVFTHRRVWGETLHAIPADAFAPWLLIVCPFETGESGARLPFRPSPTAAHPSLPLGRRMLGMLAELQRAGTACTKRGVLPKRTISRLQQRLETGLPAQWPSLRGWAAGYAHPADYPPLLAMLLDAACQAQIVAPQPGGYAWDEAALRRWLELDAAARERLLLARFLETAAAAAPSLQWIAALLPSLAPGEVCREEELLAWMRRHGLGAQPVHTSLTRGSEWANASGAPAPATKPVSAAKAVKEAMEASHAPAANYARQASDSPSTPDAPASGLARDLHDLLQDLAALGWLELGEAGSEAAMRWLGADTAQATPAPPVRLQPSGELVAFPGTPFPVLWRLEQLAEPRTLDVASVYRLTPRSVREACAGGWTSERMLAALTEVGAGEPPPLVLELLAAESPAPSPPAAPPAPHSRQPPAAHSTDPSNAPPKARQAPPHSTQPSRASHSAAPQTPEPLYLHVDELRRCPLLPPPRADRDARFPGLRDVPPAWLTQLRMYHASTKRELVEQALRWRAPLELRQQGRPLEFVPLRLDDHAGAWVVLGRPRRSPAGAAAGPELRLSPDMWEEMRVALPDNSSG